MVEQHNDAQKYNNTSKLRRFTNARKSPVAK